MIKTWTQRLRDNREANLAMDALTPPTHHEVKTAMYEEIEALRAELAVLKQQEPVGYFLDYGPPDGWCEVSYKHKNDGHVIPLYLATGTVIPPRYENTF